MTQPASAAGLRFVSFYGYRTLGSLGRPLGEHPPIAPLGKGKIKNQTYSSPVRSLCELWGLGLFCRLDAETTKSRERKVGREEKTRLPDFSRILESFIFKAIAVKEWGRGAEWGRALIERGTKSMERKRNEGFRSLCNGFV